MGDSMIWKSAGVGAPDGRRRSSTWRFTAAVIVWVLALGRPALESHQDELRAYSPRTAALSSCVDPRRWFRPADRLTEWPAVVYRRAAPGVRAPRRDRPK